MADERSRERVNALLSKARDLVEMSHKTDYRMPLIVPFIPAILGPIGTALTYIGLIFALFTGHIGLLVLGLVLLVITIVIDLYVIYKWIVRRNEHFKRSLMFFETVGEIAGELGFKRAFAIRSRLNELREASFCTRSAIANAILTIIPFYIFYVYHFLNKDFVKHSEKERLLLMDIIDELRERSPQFTRRAEELEVVPDRSFFLFMIIISALVTSLFALYRVYIGIISALVTSPLGLYWIYTLTKDPNKHFESHSVLERDLLEALRDISAKM